MQTGGMKVTGGLSVLQGNSLFTENVEVDGSFQADGDVSLGNSVDNDQITFTGTVQGTNFMVLDGSSTTGTTNKLTLKVTDPTGAKEITFPDATGTVAVSASSPLSRSDSGDISLGTVPVNKGGTGATTASAARSNLDVDQSGTDNSVAVTLATVAGNYLSISGQEITAGTVPVSLGGTGATSASAARSNLGVAAADSGAKNQNSDCARVGDMSVGSDFLYVCHTAGTGTGANRWHKFSKSSW